MLQPPVPPPPLDGIAALGRSQQHQRLSVDLAEPDSCRSCPPAAAAAAATAAAAPPVTQNCQPHQEMGSASEFRQQPRQSPAIGHPVQPVKYVQVKDIIVFACIMQYMRSFLDVCCFILVCHYSLSIPVPKRLQLKKTRN